MHLFFTNSLSTSMDPLHGTVSVLSPCQATGFWGYSTNTLDKVPEFLLVQLPIASLVLELDGHAKHQSVDDDICTFLLRGYHHTENDVCSQSTCTRAMCTTTPNYISLEHFGVNGKVEPVGRTNSVVECKWKLLCKHTWQRSASFLRALFTRHWLCLAFRIGCPLPH